MSRKGMIIILVFVIGLGLTALYAHALDYPHTDIGVQTPINCGDCHYTHGFPPWWDPQTNPVDIDDTLYNNQCLSCHTGNPSEPPLRQTHSSIETSTKYGNWTIQCWQCHDAHSHEQLDWFPDDFLYEDTISVTGGIVLNSPVANQTTIVVDSPTWTENAYQEDLVNENFFVVVPNIAQNYYVYKVLDNYFDGGEGRYELIIDGLVDLTYAAAGDTFRIYLSKLVRRSVVAPDIPTCDTVGNVFSCSNTITKAARFKDRTGPNSFADGDSALDGVCEVCHSRTNFHRGNPSEDHSHNAAAKCTDCHNHGIGFKVDPSVCDDCHGYPPTDSPSRTLVEDVYPPGTGSTTTGAHDTHVNGKGIDCSECHINSTGAGSTHLGTSGDREITIGFFLFGGSKQGGTYDGQAGVTYNSSLTVPPTNTSSGGTLQCSSIYCHSTGQSTTDANSFTPTYASPQWDTPASGACGTCHAVSEGGGLSSGSHEAHLGSPGVAGCGDCHTGAANDASSYNDPNHINGSINAANTYDAGGTPGNGYGTCSAASCHQDGKGVQLSSPVWGTPAGCSACHAEVPDSGGSHQKHVITSNYNNAVCSDCHDGAVQAVTAPSQHVDGNVDVYDSTPGDLGYTQDKTPGSAYTTCSTAYCHSTGQSTTNGNDPTPTYATPTWGNPASAACGTCHDVSGLTSGSHAAHIGASGVTGCGNCHTGAEDDASAYNSPNHINGLIDVANGYTAGGTPGNGYGMCSAAYCHSNGTDTVASPVWNTPTAGCNFCHDAQPATNAHSTHIASAATTYGDTSVNSTAGQYDFGCGNCHPTNEAQYHRNGSVDIRLDPSDGGALKSLNATNASRTGTGGSTTCSSIYCHSSGTEDLTSAASPAWGSTISGNCTDCHDNSPTSGGKPGTATHLKHVAGIHYDTIYDGTSALELDAGGVNSGAGHGDPNTSTTINCNICHNNTVTTDANDQNNNCGSCHDNVTAAARGNATIASKIFHVNGTVDVQFQEPGLNVRSRAQIRVIDDTAPELNNTWTRQVGYKTGNTDYDVAINALNTSTMYNSATKTCSTVACHNGNIAQWGETGVGCYYCHKELPDTP